MKCICCEENTIKPYDKDMTEEEYIWSIENRGNDRKLRAENRMWSDGLVANVSGGYGSTHDGSMWVIAICDKCLTKKHDSGIIAYTGDYMSNDVKFDEEDVEKSKKLWRRDQNLDRLSLDSSEGDTTQIN
jgi:hypothetical protein